MRFRFLVPTLAAMSVLVAVSIPAEAQWINHPTPGIPRTADGKPDLTAPTPRASDGKPDLSGIWAVNGLGYSTNITSVEMLPWAQKVYEARSATYGHEDPASNCLPEGPRAGLAGLEPFRIVQTPLVSFFMYESSPARQIFADGRKLPDDPTPSWMGYSVARWEADTFVVDTARDILARYVGVYDVAMLGVWTVSLDGDELKIEMGDGGGKQGVIPHSDTVFGYPPIGGPVQFTTDATGQVTGFVVTVVEGDIPAKKR